MKRVKLMIKDNSKKAISKFTKGKNKTQIAGEILALAGLITLGATSPAFAADAGTESLDTLIQFIANWCLKIGLVVAFIGGVQFAMAFKSDDADAKVRGLKTLAAGFMAAAVSKGLDMFGL